MQRAPALFGNENRTAVLLAIRLLEQTYPSELAALLGLRLFTVQSILAGLESEGAVASRSLGRTRAVELNPRYFAYKELDALLWRLGQGDVGLQTKLARRRRRPRQRTPPHPRKRGRDRNLARSDTGLIPGATLGWWLRDRNATFAYDLAACDRMRARPPV